MGSVTEQSVMGVIRAARPSFRNSHDKVAFAVHASFPASGFLLQATGPPAFSDDVLSSTSAAEVGVERWNEFDDSYAFVYSNPDKDSQRILVKCLAMNDKLLVDALREANSEPVHLEINSESRVGERDDSKTCQTSPRFSEPDEPGPGFIVPPVPVVGAMVSFLGQRLEFTQGAILVDLAASL